MSGVAGARLRGLLVDVCLLAVLAVGPVAQALGAFGRLLWRPFGMDSHKWLESAQVLGAGDWVRFSALDRPPLFPALVALLGALGLPPDYAGTEVSLVSWGLLPAAGWLALRPLTGRWPALAAALALYLSETAFDMGLMCGSQALFNLLLAVVAVVAVALMRCRPAAWVLLGLATGLATAAKEQGMLLVGPIALWALVAPPRAVALSRGREVAGRLGAFLAGLALPLALVVWLGWWLHPGGLMATKLGEYLVDARALLTAPDWREVAIHPSHWAQGKQAAPRLDPGLWGLARHATWLGGRWLVALGSPALLAPVAVLLAVRARAPALRSGAWLALLLLVPFLALIALPLAQASHVSFGVVPLALLAGIGLGELISLAGAAARPGPRRVLQVLVFAWVGILFLVPFPELGRFEHAPLVPLAGAWAPLRAQLGDAVLSGTLAVCGEKGRLIQESLPVARVVRVDSAEDLAGLTADPSARLVLFEDLRLNAGWLGFRMAPGATPVAAPGWRLEAWARDESNSLTAASFTPAGGPRGARP